MTIAEWQIPLQGATHPSMMIPCKYYQGPSGYSDIAVLPDGRVAVIFEKDGKSHLGFTILPAPPATPPHAPAGNCSIRPRRFANDRGSRTASRPIRVERAG